MLPLGDFAIYSGIGAIVCAPAARAAIYGAGTFGASVVAGLFSVSGGIFIFAGVASISGAGYIIWRT
jgi:hypothetical protein